MQPVFRLVPDPDGLRSVDDPAVTSSPRWAGRRKTAPGSATRIMSPSTHQPANARQTFLVLRLESHGGPHVGGHQVGTAAGVHRVAIDLVAPGRHAGNERWVEGRSLAASIRGP